jgi:phosphopantetheinyl transferase
VTTATAATAAARRRPDAVEIWLIPTDQPPAVLEDLAALLDPGERRRAAEFAVPEDGRRFTAAHGAMRVILGRRLHAPPEKLVWGHGGHGKPELTGRWTGARANLSTCERLAMLAVTGNREIGVDLELVRADDVALRMSARYFPPAEVRFVAEGEQPATSEPATAGPDARAADGDASDLQLSNSHSLNSYSADSGALDPRALTGGPSGSRGSGDHLLGPLDPGDTGFDEDLLEFGRPQPHRSNPAPVRGDLRDLDWSADPGGPAGRFARLWCRKEACVKVHGGRLAEGLHLPVHMPGPLVVRDPAGALPGACRVRDVPAPAGYRAAVALGGDQPFVVRWQVWRADREPRLKPGSRPPTDPVAGPGSDRDPATEPGPNP